MICRSADSVVMRISCAKNANEDGVRDETKSYTSGLDCFIQSWEYFVQPFFNNAIQATVIC